MIKKYIYSAIIILSLFTTKSYASHVAGGDIFYECIGNNNYRVYLEFRRDCFNGNPLAQFDDPASIGIFDANGNSMSSLGSGGQIFLNFNAADTLNDILTSECKIQGDDVCVERTTYIGTVTLPYNPDGYILAYQRCCRNITLNNIIEPNQQGSTYWTLINEQAQSECNSSPYFVQWPDVYICANEPLVFDHSAIDPDGDSLAYKLCVPSTGASFEFPMPQPPSAPPYDTIIWQPPYGLNDMLGGVPMTIDPVTGILTATPNLVGQFLVGVCVEEYRDGVMIGFTRRDFEYNVRVCDPHPIVSLEADPNPNCDGLTVSFEGEVSPPSTIFQWSFDYPNGPYVEQGNLNPSFTFPAAGSYDVALVGQDGTCFDTIIQTIYVADDGFEDIDVTGPPFVCENSFTVSATSETGATFEWFADSDLTLSLGTGGSLVLPFLGNQTIFVTQTNAICPEIDSISIEGEMLDYAVTTPPNNIICIGEQYDLTVVNNNPDVVLEYLWEGDATLLTMQGLPSATFVFPGSGSYMINLTVTTTNGCTDVQSFTVTVEDAPELDLPDTYNVCFGDDLELNPGGNTSLVYNWTTTIPGLVINNDAVSPLLENIEASGSVFLEVYFEGNPDCNAFFEYSIIASPQIDLSFSGETDFCFFQDSDLLASANQDGTFEWSIQPTGDVIVGDELIYFVDQDLTVTLTFTSDDNCIEDTTFMITAQEDFEILIESSTGDTYCIGEAVTLTAVYNGEGQVTWLDENGTEIGNGDSIEVNPQGVQSYTAIIVNGDCEDTAQYTLNPSGVEITLEYPDVVCEESLVTVLVVNTGSGDFEYTYDVNGTVTTSSDNQIEILVDMDIVGSVTVVNGDGCEASADFDITYGAIEGLVVEADPDIININSSTVLSTNLVGDFTYSWAPPETLDDPTSDMPVATPIEENTTYTVTVTNADGCTATGQVEVTARIPQCNPDDVFIPNMFTPNGDGVNDIFKIESIFVEEMSMVIFNRWGQKVFESTTLGSGWDGTFEGSQQDPDVYVYCVTARCINGIDYVAQGNITLMK